MSSPSPPAPASPVKQADNKTVVQTTTTSSTSPNKVKKPSPSPRLGSSKEQSNQKQPRREEPITLLQEHEATTTNNENGDNGEEKKPHTVAVASTAPPNVAKTSLKPTKARRLDDENASMKTKFFDKLGTVEEVEEAKDIEQVVEGFCEFDELDEGKKEALFSAVKRMSKQFASAANQTDENGNPKPVDDNTAQGIYYRCSRLGGNHMVARKSELIGAYRRLVRNNEVQTCEPLEQVLLKKKGKSHSGVLVITTFMGPSKFSCPKDCHYCPDQPGIARSYLLKEPGVLRGYRNGWDPIRQFFDRASALENNGHTVDKIELIILGGTFSYYPQDYAEEFICANFYAANTYFDALPLRPMDDIETEMRRNETAKCRIIGVTIETRPDWITTKELVRLRRLGCTRIQIGIQHIDDDILDTVNRDCPTSKTVVAIERALNAGFKVDAHWMPDLPGSSFEKDYDMFKFLLSSANTAFQVDQWKVYPTMTVPFTRIEEWYQLGLYKPYAELDNGSLMVRLIMYVMEHAPYRLRLNRIIRDIPTTYIRGGEARVNLRQVLEKKMREEGIVCHDIRERECKGAPINREDCVLFMDEFRASGGTEFYISVENAARTSLYGHLRIRFRDKSDDSIIQCLDGAALVRELHTYGKIVAVSEKNTGKETQHVGVGTQLMMAAEELAERRGFKKMAVISGVGVRGFYAKLGYKLEQTYMTKELTNSYSWVGRVMSSLFGA